MFGRHRSLLATAMVTALTLGSGCYRSAYRTALPPSGETYSQWNHFFLWGLINTAEINVAAVCPSGLSTLEIRDTPGTFLVSLLTLGLYSPLESTTHCASPPPSGVAPPPPIVAPPSSVEAVP